MKKIASTLILGIMLIGMFSLVTAQYEAVRESTYTAEEIEQAREMLKIDMQEISDNVERTYTTEETQRARDSIRENAWESRYLSRDKVFFERN